MDVINFIKIKSNTFEVNCIKMKIEYQEQLSLLKSGDSKVLESIYKENEGKFVSWILRNYPAISKDDAKDTFQNAIIILYENAVSGKLNELKSSIGTYLFGIGDNLIKSLYRKQVKGPISVSEVKDFEIPDELYAYIINKERIMMLLGKIGEKCQTLLVSSTSNAMKSEDMAMQLGYPSAEMYRKKKHECLKKLKGIIEENRLQINDFLE